MILDGRGDIRLRRSLLDSRHEVGLVAFPAQYSGRKAYPAKFNYPALRKLPPTPYGVLPFWVSTVLSDGFTPALDNLPGLLPLPRSPAATGGELASHLIGYIDGEGRGQQD